MDTSATLPHVEPFGFTDSAALHGVDPNDLESFCDRYGHGECYALGVALAERNGWVLRLLLDGEDCPVHVAALTPDGILVDAYGAFRDARDISGRWPEVSDPRWRDTDREEIDELWVLGEEDLEDAMAMLDEPWMTLVVRALPGNRTGLSP